MEKTRKMRGFGILLALGLAGVLSLVPGLDVAIAQLQAAGDPPLQNDLALRLLLLLQPALLVVVAVTIGLFAAPRIGLSSILVQRFGRARSEGRHPTWVRDAAIGGLVAGSVIVLGDLAFSPWTAASLEAIRVPPSGFLQTLFLGLLYGGLTEEILMRWGLLSLLAWFFHLARVPRGTALGLAVVAAAILFGISHLPALASMTELSGPLVTRTILLNGLAGCIFGALFARHSLEAAMVAHGLAHIVIFAGRLAGVAY
jgi:hypothetical protein